MAEVGEVTDELSGLASQLSLSFIVGCYEKPTQLSELHEIEILSCCNAIGIDLIICDRLSYFLKFTAHILCPIRLWEVETELQDGFSRPEERARCAHRH